MVKSTVYLEAETVLALRQLAKARGTSQADLIREAVTAYARRAGRPTPKGVGAHRSGRADVSEQAELLLRR
ncbi:MAG: CopG family transcriptional regulator, partial [Thermoanaerobaculia bacterium]